MKKVVAILFAAIQVSGFSQEEQPLHLPSGWSKSALSPLGKASYPGIPDMYLSLGSRGFLNQSLWSKAWKDVYKDPTAVDFRLAVDAMESALQAKKEIETLSQNVSEKMITDISVDAEGNLQYKVGGEKVDNPVPNGKIHKYSVFGSDTGWFNLVEDGQPLNPPWYGLAGGTSGVPVQVDSKSINTNATGKMQMAGFDKKGNGFVAKDGEEILYYYLSYTNGLANSVSAGESDVNFDENIGLHNWDSPEGTCSEYLGDILSGRIKEDDGTHYILARKNDKSLHYMKIGSVGGGSAIHFFGTVGDAVVGSGAKTNTVTFANFDDSNIEILVESDDNGNATITFGVYYQ